MTRPLEGIILDTKTGDFINFFSFQPPQKSREPVYDDVDIRGRSEPHVFYAYTRAQVWSLNIQFNASVDQNDGGLSIEPKEKDNFLESLCMPDYSLEIGGARLVQSPHLARVRILKMFDAIGTIRNYSSTYVGPYDAQTGYPYNIEASFQLHVQTPIGQDVPGFAEVRRLLNLGQDNQNP